MQTYRVSHEDHGIHYFVAADTPEQAIIKVTSAIKDLRAQMVLSAREDLAVYGLTEGIVLDRMGLPLA